MHKLVCHLVCLVMLVVAAGCQELPPPLPAIAEETPMITATYATSLLPLRTRAEAIPVTVSKVLPTDDAFPPVLHAAEWDDPIPLPGPINTAGAEDSPFIPADGNTFYFFFTPDANVPAQEQLYDGVTGIWWSKRVGNTWSEPERLLLSHDAALDGCPCAMGNELWFCSARVGNLSEIDVYIAHLENGHWTRWENAGAQLNKELDIGEFHLSTDGRTLYFHWSHAGGLGGLDLWRCEKTAQGWGEPVNLGPAVNSTQDEGWPFISADGRELWFTGTSRLGLAGPAVFRSVRGSDGSWGAAEEIVSNFAGEPTLDPQGNIYFIHHFIKDGRILEADIYIARRR